MPSACGYSWPVELDSIIREEATRAVAPLDIAYAIIAAESGFNPAARNLNPPTEDSVGLLQLNRLGGQGTGYSVDQLRDPRFNLRVGLPPIALAYAQAWSPDRDPYEFLWLVATGSGHPGQVARADPRIVRIFQLWVCFHSGAGQVGPGGSPAAAFVPGPGQSLAEFMAAFITLFLAPGGVLRNVLAPASPSYLMWRVTSAMSPATAARRFRAAFDPRRLDPTRRARVMFGATRRLPMGHRPPKGVRRR